MFRICVLKKGETPETLSREVLYRRYFMFYLTFHVIYFIICIIEFFVFRDENFAALYFVALSMMFLDCMNNGIILLSNNAPRKCLIFGTICAVATFLVYTVSRIEAFVDIDSNGVYLVFLCLLYMTFAPIELRCIYHNFRFIQFSKEQKKEKLLAMNDFEDVSKQSSLNDSNGIDHLILGTGPIEFQMMSQDSMHSTNSNNGNNSNNHSNNSSLHNSNNLNIDTDNEQMYEENDNISNFSQTTNESDDMLGISKIKNLSDKRRNSQTNNTSNLLLSSISENKQMRAINSNFDYSSNTSIINLNDVKLSNSLHSSLHSNQSSVASGLSQGSNERPGSYVPRLEENSSPSSQGPRPRTLSEKHPGFVAIK